MTPRLPPDFLDLLTALNDAEARYLLIGGHAVAFHGRPRATKDYDLDMAGRTVHVGIAALLCACIYYGPNETPPNGRPPPPPTNASSPTAQAQTFVMRTLLLGDTSRTGVTDSTAWQSYGFNIDDHFTVKDSKDVCRLVTAAPPAVQVDGNYGIDNSWASMVMPLLKATMPTTEPSRLASLWIEAGKGTLELVVTGLSDDATQSFNGLTAQVFRGGTYAGTPAFDTSTSWPVLASSLADGQSLAGGAATVFADAYSTDGIFVSGPTDGVILVDVAVAGEVPLTLTVHHPIVTLALGAPGATIDGTIAGVLDVGELRDTWMNVLLTSLCTVAIEATSLQQALMMYRDILSDGTNAPTGMCSAISIGLGFTAVRVANPTEVQADPPPVDLCPH